MTLAASTQQSVAIVLGIIVVAGWVLYLVANTRRAKPEIGSEIELAPNRKPYLDDDQLEGPKLDRALSWGLVALAVIGLGLPVYWLAEPGRQHGAVKKFDKTFAARGAALFAPTEQGGFNCAGCHGGMAGTGGQPQYTLTEVVRDAKGQPVVDPKTHKAVTKVRQVLWTAPALNTATLRFSDEQLTEVLTYGRPFSPMPAWGIAGGGPMNDQQIQNLIAYLHSIQISPAKAKAAQTKAAETELTRLQNLKKTLATEQAKPTPDPVTIRKLQNEIALNQPATMASALFNIECARCHTLGWSYGEPGRPGGGAFGPPLDNTVNQFPDPFDQIDWITNGKKFGEKYGRQGKASGRMPFFANMLTPAQIQAIADYERALSTQRSGTP